MRLARRRPIKKRRNNRPASDAALKLLDLVRGTVRTSREQVSVLERFRGSHNLILAGVDITDAKGKVVAVRRNAERGSVNTVHVDHSWHVPMENIHESH
jgi:hypothetical protein